MIPAENQEWHGVWFPGFFFFFYFIFYVYILFLFFINLTIDGINYDLNVIFMTNSSYFLLTILLKKSKLVECNTISQQA